MSYCNQPVTALWPTFHQGSLLERLGKDELPRLRLWFSAARHGSGGGRAGGGGGAWKSPAAAFADGWPRCAATSSVKTMAIASPTDCDGMPSFGSATAGVGAFVAVGFALLLHSVGGFFWASNFSHWSMCLFLNWLKVPRPLVPPGPLRGTSKSTGLSANVQATFVFDHWGCKDVVLPSSCSSTKSHTC